MAAKPIAGKEILDDDHTASNHHGVCDSQLMVTGQAVAAEDSAADDRLQQIVGKTHAPEDAEMTEHPTDAIESIPGRDDGRDNHQQDDEVVDGLKPRFQLAEIHETQYYHHDG